MTTDQDAEPGLGGATASAEAELVRAAERERVRALVEADMAVADRLQADDFQLINSRSAALSKADYLGVASGKINYHVWESDSRIAVHLHGSYSLLPTPDGSPSAAVISSAGTAREK